MAIIEKGGFKIYCNGKNSIIINSDCIHECMQFYKDNNLDGVAITTSHDYKLDNIDFLIKYPDIRHLSISEGIENINAIHALINLETLIFSGKNMSIDFSKFGSLRELIADWSPHFINMDMCLNMTYLSLYNYNPKSKDCSSIPNLPLKKLKITQSPIKTLSGLEKFRLLEKIEITLCSKLEELCCLDNTKEKLISLRFSNCKRIKNHKYAAQLESLQELAFIRSGAIQSIKFIKELKVLKSLIFMDSDVLDGDVSPCLGLEYVYFTNKRHFSHTVAEIKSLSNLS